jgi:hypothetical protein
MNNQAHNLMAYDWIKSKYGEAAAEEYKSFCESERDKEEAAKAAKAKAERDERMKKRNPNLLRYNCFADVTYRRYELAGEHYEGHSDTLQEVLESHGIVVNDKRSEKGCYTVSFEDYLKAKASRWKDEAAFAKEVWDIIQHKGINDDNADYNVDEYTGMEDDDLWSEAEVLEYFRNCFFFVPSPKKR